jgi:menaquinone-9 beta-reductase
LGPKDGTPLSSRLPRRSSDLFGFKASFFHATLPQGLLPVLSFPGGYGGAVMAEDGRLTLAGCIRRDTLSEWRKNLPAMTAGSAFESYLLASCSGVREILKSALRSEHWLSTGPLRPQVRLTERDQLFCVGNAAGETHPLIGEGMSMALQSAFLLTGFLIEQPARAIDAARALEIHRAYRSAWRNAFRLRLRLAGLFAHIAMRPRLSVPATRLLGSFPQLLTAAAHLAGKARRPVGQSIMFEGIL